MPGPLDRGPISAYHGADPRLNGHQGPCLGWSRWQQGLCRKGPCKGHHYPVAATCRTPPTNQTASATIDYDHSTHRGPRDPTCLSLQMTRPTATPGSRRLDRQRGVGGLGRSIARVSGIMVLMTEGRKAVTWDSMNVVAPSLSNNSMDYDLPQPAAGGNWQADMNHGMETSDALRAVPTCARWLICSRPQGRRRPLAGRRLPPSSRA